MQFSVAVRNARLNAIATAIGASAVLRIWPGSIPANCAAADPTSGTQLATLDLPSTWLASASAGAIAMTGTWQELSADNSGNAGFFRLYDSSGNCHMQGTVTASGGGGDMIVNTVTLVATQSFTITSFGLADGNY